MMSEARDGFGCDRHLFGLQCLAFENGIPAPEIFKDPSWTLRQVPTFYLSYVCENLLFFLERIQFLKGDDFREIFTFGNYLLLNKLKFQDL